MSQLIAGYIDIILKTRVDTDRVVSDDDDDVAEEEMMSGQFGIASMGMTMSHTNPYGMGAGQPAMNDPGAQYSRSYPGPNNPGNSQLPGSQRVNVVDMGSAVKMTRLLGAELGAAKGKFGPPGRLTEDEWRKQFNTHKAKVEEGFNDLIAQARLNPSTYSFDSRISSSFSCSGDLNRNHLDKLAKDLGMELNNMATAARNLAALNEENAPLVDGTKATADSVGELLEMLLKAVEEPNPPGFLDALVAAEKQLAGAGVLTNDPKLANYADTGAALLMVECINDIDLNMDDLLKTANDSGANLPPGQKDQLDKEIEKVKNVKGFALQSLRDLAPQVLDPLVANQIHGANATLAGLTADLVQKCRVAGVPQTFGPMLTDAQDRINLALKNLVEAAKTAEAKGLEGNLDIITPTQELLSSLAMLRANLTDPNKVIEGVKSAASSQNQIITVAKSLAEGADPDTKTRLQNASTNISSSVKDLLNEARLLTRDPSDLSMQGKVVAVVGRLEGQCQELITDAGAISALHNLRFTAKATTAGIIKLMTASSLIGAGVSDGKSRADLLGASKKVQGSLAGLLAALQSAASDPNNFVSQSELLEAARQQIPHYSDLVSNSKKAARFVGDANKKQELSYAANDTSDNLRLLMKAISAVSDMTNQEDLEDSLAEFDSVRADLEAAEFYAHQGLLTPIPGQSRDNALALLQMASDTVNKAVDDLCNAAKTGAPLPPHVKAGAAGMSQVATAARSMASTISDRAVQKKIVGSAKELSDDAINMVALARALKIDKENPAKREALEKSRRDFAATLGNLMAASRGLESKDVNKAIEEINRSKGALSKNAPTRLNFKDASNALQGNAKALSAAIGQISSVAANNPTILGSASKMTGATTTQLMLMVSNAASATQDSARADDILRTARSLADAMGGLLNAAKIVAVKKNPQTLKGLQVASDQANSAIEELVGSLGNAASPEADQAIHRIMSLIAAIDNGSLEVIPGTREDILNEFLQCAKDMARVTGSLVTSARVSTAKMGLFAKEAATVVKTLLTAAKAAGLSDGSGATMSLDGARIVKGAEFILENPEDTKKVLGVAKRITQSGAKLIAVAKETAKSESDKQKRAEIVRNAQSVVNTATQLAQASRDASKRTPQSLQRLTQTAQALKDFTIALEGSMRSNQSAEDNPDEAIDAVVASQLMTTSRTIAMETSSLIRASSAVSADSDNAAASDDLKSSTRKVTEAIQQLIKTTGSMNPGIQECERAIQSIQTDSAELDAANISATVGNLSVPGAERAPFAQHQQNTSAACKQMAESLKAIVGAAGGSSKDLVAAAQDISTQSKRLVGNVKLTAGSSAEREVQSELLQGAKDVTDSLIATIRAVMNTNLNDRETMAELTSTASATSENIGLLLGHLQSGQQLHADLDRVARTIQGSLGTMAQPAPPSSKSYADCREELSNTSKALAAAVSTLLTVDKRNLGQVNLAASRMGELVPQLVENCRECIATTREQSAKNEMMANTKALGGAVVAMIGSVKQITSGQNAQPQLRQASNSANASIANLLSAAKKGAVGEVMMDRAIASLNATIGKLNSASIFAQAGQLEQTGPQNMTLPQLHQHLSANCQKTQQAVSTTARAIRESDERLGASAEELAKTIKTIADISTAIASRLPDSNSQQEVISSGKAAALASHQLILSAKDAQRLPNDSTAQQTLAASQTAVAESISKLIEVVRNSNSDYARGEKELEEVKNEIKRFLANVPGTRGATADDVVAAAREVLTATSSMAFASTQEESITAAKESYTAVEKLLNNSKGASALSQDPEIRKGVTQWAGNTARSMIELIDIGKLNRQDPASQPRIEAASGKVSAAINGLVTSLRKLPNSEHVTLQDAGLDLDAKAEQELLKCASIIENAAKTLLAAKPPPREKKANGVLDKLDIQDAIFDAASAIARATGSLVSTAAVAQRERQENNRKAGNRYQNDPTWANGLISASQSVAGSVQDLVGAANEAVSGEKVEEEALIASARAVASSTAHLVAAAKAKSDPSSLSQQNLSKAAKAVANATSALVSAAGKAATFQDELEEEEDLSAVNFQTASGRKKELEQQMRILRLEKELEKERVRMATIHKAKYSQDK